MMFAAMAAAASFNLVCAGSLSTSSIVGSESEPYSTVYRIDLDAKRWCESDCKVQHDFATILPVQLTLQDTNVDTPRRRERLLNMVDRETGKHTIIALSGVGSSALTMKWAGSCDKAAFTGFPAVTTKF